MESPYTATIDSDTEQVKADPENSIQIGGASYVKLTASTYDVETLDGKGLVVNPDNIICKLVDGVPETTIYSVIDTSQPSSATFIPTSNEYYVRERGDMAVGTMSDPSDESTFTQALTEEGDYIYTDSTAENFVVKDSLGNNLHLQLKDSDGYHIFPSRSATIIYYLNGEYDTIPMKYNGVDIYLGGI